MDQLKHVKLPRHLTEDETIEICSKHGLVLPFRVRVWRGKDCTPICLVSPARGIKGVWTKPSGYSAKIANFVNSAILGYPGSSLLYYEYDRPTFLGIDGDGESVYSEAPLCQVHFEYFGTAHRLKLYKGLHRSYDWMSLELVLGGPVDR